VDGTTYGYGAVLFDLNNPNAGVPTKDVISIGVDGNYSDAGSLTNYNAYIYDEANGTYLMRLTGGASPKFGLFNTSPIVKQAGASAAGIAAVIDANAKAALTALQAALAAYGLVTSPA